MKTRTDVLRKPNVERSIRHLAETLAHTESPGEIREFMQGGLTPSEIARMALRWELVKLLERGVAQRTISEVLGISLCKITRGSRELKKGPRGFRTLVLRGLRIEGHAAGDKRRPGRPRTRKG